MLPDVGSAATGERGLVLVDSSAGTLWRDNPRGKRAAIRMASQCRGEVIIVAMIFVRKGFVGSDCRGASISESFGCRVRGRSSRTTLSFERSAPTIAFDVHLDDGGVVNEAIDGGESHGVVRAPFAEWLIGGDQHRAPLVMCADEIDQQTGLGLILGDVGEDKQIEAIKTINAGSVRDVAAAQQTRKSICKE